ncbi:MAG: HPr family phosphocarrier protein [Desulfobulbus sp.]|nr:MAG: HPr family phosphocarrier protein [Desulfobulbus sp.]
MKVLEKKITVTNARGVHSRVATRLAMIAREHHVGLRIIHGPDCIDAASILDVLGLALVCGSKVTVRIEGERGAVEPAMAAVRLVLTAQDES